MKKIFSILMAVLFVGSMYAADVTDTIAMKGFAGITTVGYQNQTKSDVSAKGVDMVAYAYIGSTGQVRGSKTAVAGASVTADDNSKNWSLYNSAAMPGAIKSIKVTQAATGTNIFQNKLYVSLGTATQGDVTAITSAQAQDDGATANEINFTIDASKKYTYFKLLSTEKFTSGSVSDVKVMVTYEKAESSTKTYYLTLSSDWAGWPAKYAIYYFKSSDNTQNGWSEFMTAVPEEDNTYIGTIPAGYDKLIFVRFNSEATAPAWDSNKWSQTVDLTAPTNDNDWFTVTSGGTGSECNGTWSKHGEPVIPAKFYITGDSALVTDAGAPGKAWNPDAIKSETDTFTLKNLKAGQDYILKLTLNGTWEGENNIKGYNELTEKTPGLKDISDDHNIGFKLNEAGDVQVIYKDGETPVFKLVGNFVVEIPHYFIAGTMTNWKDEMVELPLNLKADSLYLYKIVRVQGTDTAWYGLDGEATMGYGNSTGWYIYKSEGEKNQKNVGLQTTKEAVYPFVLKVKEDHLEVSVTIPARYYAKYAPNWEWAQLIEKEGKWLTDTIVYAGIGVNINVKASDEGNMFFSNTVEEEGVRPIAGDEIAELDTVQFSFNPVDTTLTVSLISKYVAPAIHYYVAGTMTNSLNLKADSLYLYKIVRVQGTDTAWYGLDGEATMEYGKSTGWYIYKSEGDKNQKNVGLQTTKEGDYPVTLVIKEDQLIVSVVIPKPDTKYYAKYADKAGEWNWKLLTEKEGKWLTDTIVYYGGGMNIHSAAEGDGKYFAEIAGVAAKDTAFFTFNPEDSTLVATVVGKYIKPFPVMQIAGQWNMEGENWIVNNMVLAADSLTATYEVSLEKGDYEFKLIKDGKWITKANGGEPYGLHRTWPGVAGVVDEATENLKVTADVAGKYLFTWTFANDSIGITFPDKPDQPEGIGGYYLVGSFNNWVISAAYKFVSNEEANYDEKILRDVTLAVGDELKVVTINDAGDVIRYYPEGADNNYVVDAAHAGVVTVYFTPWANPDWESFHEGGWFFIPSNTGTGIDETADGVKAVKVLRNGQILIIKGEKTYNALGILVE